ncbi:MAG: polysaccharide export protein [Acidobacteria bacterium]|nr:MAG: polysaccharide export protein [Acidobacteriota bacterium]PYY03661.1 MAG: polysaccharide export protein [Acidobacteriota bacterium]PYY20548.1 MAG: polysaccharide export protein [Acidobacteriota bacterium]
MLTRRFVMLCCAILASFPVIQSLLLAQNSAQISADSYAKSSGKRVDRVADDAVSKPSTSDPRIGPGDLLELKVFAAPELSGTLRVSGAGDITVPLIGAAKVAGLTAEQAQKDLEQRLLSGGFMRDPHVNILVKEFATQGISVLGEVAHPGIYPLLGSPRLFDALSAAGGTTNRAGKTIYISHRERPSAGNAVLLSQDPKQALAQNLFLQPGDTVMVSRAGIVYVSGDVKTPGGYVMNNDENLTVLQAIALAQGVNPTASTKNVRIIRRKDGKLQEIPVELKQIMAAKAPDIALENEDVLFVPNSASKSAVRRSMESIVQVATGLAIYRR